jgi:Bacterial TSP3 repeat
MSYLDRSRRPASSRRRSDLRFAGIVSGGMIATVFALAALLAPLLAWNGSPVPNARERDQTIHLSRPSERPPTPTALSADRAASQVAAGAAGRLVAIGPLRAAAGRRAAGVAPGPTGRVGVTERAPRSTVPRRTSPLATSSRDTDGDGLPDAWELRYGLDPEDAADATADPDGDGLDNRTERRIRTAPNGADSNRNGISDGNEDTDGDGAPNLSEQLAGTDPGSSADVPPVADTEAPGPVVVEDAPTPEPEPPADAQPEPEVTPVPAPDIPVPADPVPEEPVPADPVPADPVPADPVPADPAPADPDPLPDPTPVPPAGDPATDAPAPTPAATPTPAPTVAAGSDSGVADQSRDGAG